MWGACADDLLAGLREAGSRALSASKEAQCRETVSLGSLPLRLGGSLVGWVEAVFGERLPRGLQVKALLEENQPLAPFGRPQVVPPQLEAHAQVAGTEFFQVAELSAGSYRLEVVAESRAIGSTSEILISKGRETLLESPVVVRWPRLFRAVVEPPLHPKGKGWTVELRQSVPLPGDPGRYFLEPWMRQTADGSGEARFFNLTPGAYALVVRSGDEAVLEQLVDVPEESAFEEMVSLQVDWVNVSGRWRCRGEPLQRKVALSTSSRKTPLPLPRTVPLDAEGAFSSWIFQEDGTLSFSFEGALPNLHLRPGISRRLLPGVRTLKVDLDLKGARVSGRVVSPQGEPRSDVTLRFEQWAIFVPEGKTSSAVSGTVSGQGGEFELPCLLPGQWQVWAEDRKTAERSRPVLLDLIPEGELSDLTLRLERLESLSVELRRASGFWRRSHPSVSPQCRPQTAPKWPTALGPQPDTCKVLFPRCQALSDCSTVNEYQVPHEITPSLSHNPDAQRTSA